MFTMDLKMGMVCFHIGNIYIPNRMKFPLVVPCPFPRLKMTVYDFSPFGTNESMGEATMSLKP